MPQDRLKRGLRITFIGMLVNALLAIGKMLAGVIGNSHALVADATESLADIISSMIVWRGMVLAAEPADAEHPYGHGKAEPLAAATVASMILLASLWIILQAVHGMFTPGPGPARFTLVVLIAVIVIKEGLFRYVVREGAQLESSVVVTDAWHHRSDAVTSLCALIGISIAVIGGPKYVIADRLAALVAAGIIGWNGWRLLRPALLELMDTAPGPDLTNQMIRLAAAVPGVERVEKCLARKMGYDLFVDMHVEVDPNMSVQRAHEIAHEVKDRIRERLPTVRDVLVHVEPGEGGR